jgi:hypothetical protein
MNIITKLNKNDIKSIDNLDKKPEDLDIILDVDAKDISIIKNIATKIFNMANKHNLEITDILVLPQSYLPEEFKDKMIESYKKFQSDNCELRDIYDISLSSSIRDERRRLLYRDIFDKFISNTKILKNIDKWCIDKNKDIKNIILKLNLNDKSRMICGEIDMYDALSKTLIDFKVSSSNMKLEWILQLLSYTAIMRKQHKLDVDYIQIYNPLMGTETTFDIKKWNKEDELLDYIVKIRMNKLNRNTINQITKPSNNQINKPKNIIDDFLDLNTEELEAMKNIKLIDKVNNVNKVDKVKISKKRIL